MVIAFYVKIKVPVTIKYQETGGYNYENKLVNELFSNLKNLKGYWLTRRKSKQPICIFSNETNHFIHNT